MTSKLPKCIRPEEFIKLIGSVPKKDKIAKTAFLLGYGSGLRVSEVKKLKQANIGNGNNIFIENAKGGKDRVVPKPKGWKSYMLDLLPMKKSIRTLQRKFTNYNKKAGLNPDYSFHSLRHGFATRCLESGVPLNQVQLLLGHSDISTTGIYTKADPRDALKSYEEYF